MAFLTPRFLFILAPMLSLASSLPFLFLIFLAPTFLGLIPSQPPFLFFFLAPTFLGLISSQPPFLFFFWLQHWTLNIRLARPHFPSLPLSLFSSYFWLQHFLVWFGVAGAPFSLFFLSIYFFHPLFGFFFLLSFLFSLFLLSFLFTPFLLSFLFSLFLLFSFPSFLFFLAPEFFLARSGAPKIYRISRPAQEVQNSWFLVQWSMTHYTLRSVFFRAHPTPPICLKTPKCAIFNPSLAFHFKNHPKVGVYREKF